MTLQLNLKHFPIKGIKKKLYKHLMQNYHQLSLKFFFEQLHMHLVNLNLSMRAIILSILAALHHFNFLEMSEKCSFPFKKCI